MQRTIAVACLQCLYVAPVLPSPKGGYIFMPLNKKGEKIKKAMEQEYGKKKGDSVFYASEKKGTIKGVTKSPQKKDK